MRWKAVWEDGCGAMAGRSPAVSIGDSDSLVLDVHCEYCDGISNFFQSMQYLYFHSICLTP